MRILQVHNLFYPQSDIERYFFQLTTGLEDAGHTVYHLSTQQKKNFSSPYEKYFLPLRPSDPQSTRKGIYSLHSAELVKRLVKATKPDVAHLHQIQYGLTPAVIIGLRNAGVPIVQTLHDYKLICPNAKLFTQGSPCERCKKIQYWNAVKNLCEDNSTAASIRVAVESSVHNVILKTYEWGVNRFITPSQFLHAKLLEWGWSKSQVEYIPHCTDKRRGQSQKKKNSILYVGPLQQSRAEEKGVELLMTVAKQMAESHQHSLAAQIEFVFAGNSQDGQWLEKRMEREHLQNCRFVPLQSEISEVHEKRRDALIAESRAVVVPSLSYENAPLHVYESLALGTPVIGAKHGGLVELIQEGVNGYFCTPGDQRSLQQSIEKVIQSDIGDLPENRFTSKDHIEALISLYTKIQSEQRPLLPL